jgi:hypothetical protein
MKTWFVTGLLFFASLGFSQVVVTNPLGGMIDAYRLGSEIRTNRAIENALNAQAEALRAQTERLRQAEEAQKQGPAGVPDGQLAIAIAAVNQRYPDFNQYFTEAARLMPQMSSSVLPDLPHYLEGMYLIAKYASFSNMAVKPQESPAVALMRDPEFHRLPMATRIRFARAVEPDLSEYKYEDLEIVFAAIAVKVNGITPGASPPKVTPAPEPKF